MRGTLTSFPNLERVDFFVGIVRAILILAFPQLRFIVLIHRTVSSDEKKTGNASASCGFCVPPNREINAMRGTLTSFPNLEWVN